MVVLRIGVDDMNTLFGGKAKLFRAVRDQALRSSQAASASPPCDESRQHFPAAIDPSAQFLPGRNPVALIKLAAAALTS